MALSNTIHNSITTHDLRKRQLQDLRISVIDQCNLRCRYCMPAEVFGAKYPFLKRNEYLSTEQISQLVKHFANCGVQKVRLTGGEPLLRKELPEIISEICNIEQIKDIALSTNGLLLKNKLPELIDAGLQRINISLDALDNETFSKISGKNHSTQRILDAIDAADEQGLEIKVNMVVLKGVNDKSILPMAAHFKNRNIQLRFIEYMDVGNAQEWTNDQVMSYKEILEILKSEYDLSPKTKQNEVAKRYRYNDDNNQVGFISSVSEPFCSGCTRARVSANGKLYTCLFSNKGDDLKAHLQSNTLEEYIRKRWAIRDDNYSEIRSQLRKQNGNPNKVEMSHIGG